MAEKTPNADGDDCQVVEVVIPRRPQKYEEEEEEGIEGHLATLEQVRRDLKNSDRRHQNARDALRDKVRDLMEELEERTEELEALKDAHQGLQKDYDCIKRLNNRRLSMYKATYHELMSMGDDSSDMAAHENQDEEAADIEPQPQANLLPSNSTSVREPSARQQTRKSKRNVSQTRYRHLNPSEDMEFGLSNSGSDSDYLRCTRSMSKKRERKSRSRRDR